MGFESFTEVPPEEKLPEQKPGKSKSVFQKLRGSKIAKAIAFAGLLGVSGALAEKGFDFQNKPAETKYEPVKEREVELGELSKKFLIKKEISGKNPLFLHIGQTHGADSLKETDEAINREELISKQKDIESLIMHLRDNYGLKQYYVEGMTRDIFNLLRELKQDLEKEEFTKEKTNRLVVLFQNIAREKTLSERYRSYLLYAIQEKIKKEFSRTENEESKKALSQILSFTEQNPLISGNNMYLWGSPVKLYLENKIDILPAETLEANEKAFAPFVNEEDRRNMERRHNIREDAAVNIIKESVRDAQTIVPLVYGVGHNFKDNIEANNKISSKTSGLLKIEPVAK